MNNTKEQKALEGIIDAIYSSVRSVYYEPLDRAALNAQIVRDLSEAYLNLIKSGNERGFDHG